MFKTILNNFHLEKLIWIIKSKLNLMILAALIGAVIAGGVGTLTQSSTYKADVTFYVYSNPDYATETGVNLSSSDITQASTLLASYMQILYSNTFLEKVIETTGLEKYTTEKLKKEISATSVSNTAVFKVSVYDDNPINAMNIANAISELAPAEIIGIVKSGGIEVLDEAQLPTEPYSSTSIFMYALLGAAAGFMLVAMIAVLKGMLNTTIRRQYEIEDMFNIPILGVVPLILPGKKEKVANVFLDEKSSFDVKEAYSNIRASLMFTRKGVKCPIYAITSADCNEGKTTNALNIANSFAQVGKKVLVIDADMRNGDMDNTIGAEARGQGLSEYLSNMTDDVKFVKYKENMDVILAGTMPPNPAELLVSEKWYELLASCQQQYDEIFVDLSSLGIVADALSLAEAATAYILIVRERLTRTEREEMVVRRLEAAGANICGFVYNAMSTKSPDYNYKNYGKEYGRKKM
jgi:capsular exopolysaccharide synthesis family protein